ncbi:hypothetical protein [Lentibacter algarum]|uniref:hypothetical protein n=1 Tax=Lentibacter algarum TaxID=576131 RepID=UPI0026EA2588|nr:hypothetical protein [Lentibacter algarum]
MPLIELTLPKGLKNNGTDMQSEGRWRDGNLIRWTEDALGPVGGWIERMASAYAAAPRGMIAWEDDASARWIAAGTYSHLYVSNASGTTFDITPAGFTSGIEDAAVNTGFGGGFFGTGFFGQPRPDTGNYSEATTWDLDTWGQYLVGCSSDDGKLYEWQLATGTPAAAISNAPTSNLGVVVTDERFVFALGAGGNPRHIQWCDFEDNTLWTAASTNQAGDHTLQTSGRIQAGIRAQGQTLIITDRDAHRCVYTGPPFIHQFEKVGDACGLVARKALANTPAGVFWMGQNGFFRYNGSSVEQVPCEIHDKVFKNRSTAQSSKCWAVTNGQHNEVWFFYPSSASVEVDSYAAFDYGQGIWTFGSLDRTAGVDRGIFRTPIWADATSSVYDHETGYNYDSNTIFIESGPMNIGAGDNTAIVTKVIPDEAALGDVQLTLKSRYYPTGAETSHGPYTAVNPTSVRVKGRQLRVRLEAQLPGKWRVGNYRAEVRQGGKR